MGATNDSKSESTGKVTFSGDKLNNFSDWYDQALSVGDIVDPRYPGKGMMIWRPYGFKALKLMFNIMETELEKYGHEETYFPMLIPASVFEKERDFLRGFKGEAFVVTNAGDKKLTENLYIRPTSETVIYESVRLWIRSDADLPLKIFQTVNIFRHETKTTRPLFRLREVVKFNEAHTFHATAQDAQKQIEEGIEIYKHFFDSLMIPYIIVRTPSWDTFAGAMYNYDFMSIMPDGKAMELASVINLGDKFAKAFGIKYAKSDGSHEFVHQTCYGISERELGVLLSVHGDNNGLVIPPIVAPIQIAIVPIFRAEGKSAVIKKAEEVKEKLSKLGYRVLVDARDKKPGEKFYELDAKGIPIKVEIGQREMDSGKLVVSRRDNKEKVTIDEKDLAKTIDHTISAINKSLKENSAEYLKKRILHFATVKELKSNYTERLGMVGLPWCNDEKCGKKLEEEIGIPTIGYQEKKAKDACASCGKKAQSEMFFGRTY